MSKYEIVIIIEGKTNKDEVDNKFNSLIAPLANENDFKVDNWGKKKLAYPIKKNNFGYYYIVNVTTDKTDALKNIKNFSNITSYILRCEIFNVEKEYGYKSLVNPIKIKRNEAKAKKYEEFKKKRRSEYLEQIGGSEIENSQNAATSDGKKKSRRKVVKIEE